MLFHYRSPTEKRKHLKKELNSSRLLQFPGAFCPFVALMIEQLGFDGVYLSGGAFAAQQGWPDVGLTTLTEVVSQGNIIAKATTLPTLIDADTGFGEEMNIARTIHELEDKGLSGCHIEDQVFPKRCGHLDHKELQPISVMVKKIQAAASMRKDSNFLLIARTDAKQSEGIEGVIKRANHYLKAGADVIFPEALHSEEEFKKVRDGVNAPLLANMTEFGKTPLLDTKTLESIGYNIVIYPVTTFRLAMHAVEEGLKQIKNKGSQKDLLESMQTRQHLYELLEYKKYQEFDQSVFNFEK